MEHTFDGKIEDSPNRCQASNNQGQCRNTALEGAKNCAAHGGNKQQKAQETIRVRGYLLAKYNARARDHADDTELKSLRGEIGILRMLLENKLNQCGDPIKLAIQAPALSDLVMKIQKLVTGCHKLEVSLGQTLDQEQIMGIADSIINVISKHITDTDLLQKLADEIVEAITNGKDSDNRERSL